MSTIELLIIAIGLAMDAFAVSLVASSSGRCRDGRAAFRLAFHFGLFQFAMPVIGWLGGSLVADAISAWDHWAAFGLLAFVGGRMIHGSRDPVDKTAVDPSRGWSLVMLSIATSIDALAVGISLAMLEVSIWYASGVIGLVAALLSLVGVRLGSQVPARLGKRMELVGGILLMLIGVRILLDAIV